MISEEYFANLSQKLQDDTEDFILKLLRRIRRRAQELIGNPDANINLSDEERRIAAQWEAYNRKAREWVDQNLPKAYRKGVEEAARGLPDTVTISAGQFASVPLLAGGGFGGDISDVAAEMLADLPRHHTMYGVFQEAAYIGFADTRIPVVRSATDKIRRLTILASDNAYRNTDTLTRRELTQEVMRGLSDRGITGIRYSDGRTMKLDSYAEVVARSQTGNAARQAHMNRLQEYGRDLILISAHYPVSPLCEPWQGRVYSLSGDSENYPPLERATSGGLYHANCKHSQSGYAHGQKIPDAAEKVDKRTNQMQYEAQQRQRYNERQIRKWKRRETTAVTDDAQRKAKGKITEWQKAQREHLDENEFLRRRYDREQV